MEDDDFLDALGEGQQAFGDDDMMELDELIAQEEERLLNDERMRLEEQHRQQEQAKRAGGAGGALRPPEGEDDDIPITYDPLPQPEVDVPESELEEEEDAVSRAALQRVAQPPRWDAKDVVGATVVPVTSTETFERVYCGMDNAASALPGGGNREQQQRQWRRAWRRQGTGLTAVPIQELMEEVETKRLKDAVRESERVREQIQARRAAAGTGSAGAEAVALDKPSELWVDKYRPRRVIDLLNDDLITRQLLHWVRSWNPVVFNKPAPPPMDDAAMSKFGGKFNKGAPNGAGFHRPKASNDGRPEHKVILIAGPPGLGKTTLAHVIARHCGYRVVEINASDDRTAGSLTQRIHDAVQMQSVIGEKKPNLVIVDEIDGALGGAEGRGAINSLLKIVNAGRGQDAKGKKRVGEDEGANNGREGGGAGRGGDSDAEDEAGPSSTPTKGGKPGGAGKSRSMRPLSRPIICICNDAYVPALRPLREVAHVIHFSRPVSSVLTQRLRWIAEAEGMKCESRALSALVERAEGDIRNCLHSMQFLARQKKALTLQVIQTLNLGQKDMTTSAFGVWEQIFFEKRARSNLTSGLDQGESWRGAYDAIRDFGDYSLLSSGVLENLHQARYNNKGLRGTVSVLQYLSECDKVVRTSFKSMDFALTGYCANLLVMSRQVVTTVDRTVRLEWPKADQVARTYQKQQNELVKSWLSGCSGVVSSRTANTMASEVVPTFVHLVSPAVRPVAKHLLSIDEKSSISSFISTAIAYNIKLADPEGLAKPGEDLHRGSVPLEPPIDSLALYGSDHPQGKMLRGELRGVSLFRPIVVAAQPIDYIKPMDTTNFKAKPVSAAVRQLLAHEMEVERIRRAAAGNRDAPSTQGGYAGPSAPPKVGPIMRTIEERMAANAQNLGIKKRKSDHQNQGSWLDTLKRKKADESRAVSDRTKLNEIQSKAMASASKPQGNASVLYKFNEGYTNAVKRPLVLKNLL